MTDGPTRYAAFPDHPLVNIDPAVIAAAREVLAGAVMWKDVHPDMADPIADAVVIGLLPFIPREHGGTYPG